MPKGVTLWHCDPYQHTAYAVAAWSAWLLPGTRQAVSPWGTRPGSFISVPLASPSPVHGMLSASFLEFDFVPTAT